MGRDDFQPSSHARLCSKHFQADCFDRSGERVFLRKGAIPTIFQTTLAQVKLVEKMGKIHLLDPLKLKCGRCILIYHMGQI